MESYIRETTLQAQEAQEIMEKEIGWILNKNITRLKKQKIEAGIFYAASLCALINKIVLIKHMALTQGVQESFMEKMIKEMFEDANKKITSQEVMEKLTN